MAPLSRLPPRRRFLRDGSLWLLAAGSGAGPLPGHAALSKSAKPLLRAGLITDLHYADKTVRGSRHYRETLDKIAEAGTAFDKAQTDFVVELVALDTKHPQHEEKRSLEWR